LARFTQAISEGDGISLVPLLAGDVELLSGAAEESGAEAVAVASAADVERLRAVSGLPVLLCDRIRRESDLDAAEQAGVDAVFIALADFEDEDERLQALHADALTRELDCAIEVHDEEGLEQALQRLEPDIFAIANPRDDDGEAFERTLDVLPDVPAGKLVIAETGWIVREQLLALERAGVDAVLVSDLAADGDFRAALAGLIGS
jgi:indole-3-glycerol phosphate synthase